MSPPTPDFNSACYYAVLGLDKSATDAEVKKAYRKCALETHPDKNPDSREKAEADFKKVNQAYSVLQDPEQRKKYDQFGKAAFEQSSGCAGENIDPTTTFCSDGAGGLSAAQAEAMFREVFGNLGGGGPNHLGGFSTSQFGFAGLGSFGGQMGGIFVDGIPTSRNVRHRVPPHAIPAGTPVLVQGLTKASEHNGKTGVVASWEESSRRYRVNLEGGQVLSLRPQCVVQQCRIEVAGLESKPELNGRMGDVYGFDEAKGRYMVLLENPAAQVLSLQPSNCVLSEGVRVVLTGLSKASFNDQMAHIVSVHRDAMRYTVQTQDRQRIKVKFANVRC